MKYRLYGRDGLNDKEFSQLIEYIDPASGDKKEYVVKRRHDYDYQLSILQARDAQRQQARLQLEKMQSIVDSDVTKIDKTKIETSSNRVIDVTENGSS